MPSQARVILRDCANTQPRKSLRRVAIGQNDSGSAPVRRGAAAHTSWHRAPDGRRMHVA